MDQIIGILQDTGASVLRQYSRLPGDDLLQKCSLAELIMAWTCTAVF